MTDYRWPVERAEIEALLREHGSEHWDDAEISDYAEGIADLDDFQLDEAMVAHAMWTMGATVKHTSACRNLDDDHDGDYENGCEHCTRALEAFAALILEGIAISADVAEPSA